MKVTSARSTPEERELQRKQEELAELQTELAQLELDLATLRGELRAFERQYIRVVGARYAELDALQAKIAELEARRRPQERTLQEEAARAQAQARESAEAMRPYAEESKPTKFTPSEDLKRLYREIAKRLHPDLATTEQDCVRRTRLMAEANQAYEGGNEAGLRAILEEWETGPESVEDEGVGAELIRTIRRIAQAQRRLLVIEEEMVRLRASELCQLKGKVDEAEGHGRDLLAEMALQVDLEIVARRKRLEFLIGSRPKV